MYADGAIIRLQAPYTVGARCAACPDDCTADGKLCKSKSQAASCADVSVPLSLRNEATGEITHYNDCNDLITRFEVSHGSLSETAVAASPSVSEWCTKFDSTNKWCPLMCGACTPPAGIGSNFCSRTIDGRPIDKGSGSNDDGSNDDGGSFAEASGSIAVGVAVIAGVLF